jgi:hypothetical protein
MPGALTIRRLRVVALTPPDHPEPESFRARLEDTVRGSLASALAEAIDHWGGEGVLRIQRLEVDLATGTTLSPDHLTAQLAEAIANGLVRARAEGERVLSFAGRSHYIAAFLQELVTGRAWQRWWFRGFEGVKVLPLSTAIRTTILADPDAGLSALLSMPRGVLATVLAKLSDHDATQLLDAFAARGKSGISSPGVVPALAAARRESTFATLSVAALALYLGVVRLREDCGGPLLAEMAKALLSLERLVQDRSSALTSDLCESDPALSATLATLPGDLRQALIATAMHQPGVTATSNTERRRYTPFGGLFIILPSLDLEAVKQAVESTTGPHNNDNDIVSAAALIGFVTLAACAGRARAAQVVVDPVWRDVFDLPPAVDGSTIARRLAAIPEGIWAALAPIGETLSVQADARFLTPARNLVPDRIAARAIARLARATMTRFARRLPGFSNSSAPFLWRNLLDVTAAVDTAGPRLSVLLDRCPLDVLLSINGIADADITAPGGTAIRLRRRPL